MRELDRKDSDEKINYVFGWRIGWEWVREKKDEFQGFSNPTNLMELEKKG